MLFKERQREMDRNSWSVRVQEERKNLSFFKTFGGADLSSECMRTFPFDFMKSLPKEEFSNKMVINAKWGHSWEVDISKNPRFYYMEKPGWNQFVRDNALGRNEFVTFTHKGLMCFDVNIYGQNEKEIVRPRNTPTVAPSSGFKQEASMEGVEFEATEKKAEESKTSKKKIKKMVNSVEVGESSRRVKLNVSKTSKKIKKVVSSVEVGESSRRVKLNISKTSKMKSVKRDDGVRVNNGLPEFEITIKNSGLALVVIPKCFQKHIPKSKMFKIHHSEGRGSWEVMCLVRTLRTFSKGWAKLARECPLEIGDKCTFQLFNPNEFILTITKKAREEIINKAREEITVID